MKQYRLLSDGEITQAGDEYYGPKDGWLELSEITIGKPYKDGLMRPVRRLIEQVQPDIPADGEPVIVWHADEVKYKRYSTGKIIDGRLECYQYGATKWSSDSMPCRWANWRRPTKEELA